MVIPVCDGDGREEQFIELLADLRREYGPEGPVEEFHVVKITEAMWKHRRATRAEKAVVREAVVWKGEPPTLFGKSTVASMLFAIGKGEEGVEDYGPLSQPSLLGSPHHARECRRIRAPQIAKPEPIVDLLKCMSDAAYNSLEGWLSGADQLRDDYCAIQALPSELVMNKILRYETVAQKRLD
jgi:hypothetical protein